MSKIKLTGSNSGYVEIASAADAGNLTLTLPTGGTALLSNAGNVFSGITTTGQLDINGSIDVSSTSVFNDDLTLTGASYNVLWDKSDNQLEFGDNAKLSFGGSQDLQIFHNGSVNLIQGTNSKNIYIQGDDVAILNQAGNQTSIWCNSGGSVDLHYANSQKFRTTNTGAVVTGICTATSFSGSGEGLTYTSPLSHRNILINGDMRVAQRATSASMSSAGNHIPTCDRWQYNRNGVTATVAQVADAPAGRGFKYSLKWTSTSAVGSIAAGNVVKFSYSIERQDILRLGYGSANGKTVTLSFWAKGSLSGKIGVSCTRDSRIFSANEDIVANTWKFVEITIPADTSTGFSGNDNDGGFYFGITWGAGSNSTSGATNSWINFHNAYSAGFTAGQQGAYLTTNGSTFQITGVQLEIGSQSTPFEHRSFGEELARCQRYFYKVSAAASGTGSYKHLNTMQYYAGANPYGKILDLPVPMRTIPTGSFTGDIRAWTAAGSNNGSFTTINFDRNDNLFLGSNGSTTNQNSGGAGNATPITLYPSSTMSADAEL